MLTLFTLFDNSTRAHDAAGNLTYDGVHAYRGRKRGQDPLIDTAARSV